MPGSIQLAGLALAWRELLPVGVLRGFTNAHFAVDQPTKAGGNMKLPSRFLFAAILVLGVLSLGIAVEDLASAQFLFEKAKATGRGQWVEL